MKKLTAISFAVLALLLLAGCGGNTSTAGRHIGESTLYTEAEIAAAMDAAERKFKSDFDGCTLILTDYNEEFSAPRAEEWAAQYSADEAIVLRSEFETGSEAGGGSLNPNETYRGWQWILTRDEGGSWTLRTWGYG